jgi:DNA-binding transcriptional MerR regulator
MTGGYAARRDVGDWSAGAPRRRPDAGASRGSDDSERPDGRGRAGAAAGGRLQERGLTIGEVLDSVREEFPDVTLSKIRYLEAEGLVEPARTRSNYRAYSPADVERLRYVLGAQRDRHLPLKVIRQELESLDRGERPEQRPGPRRIEPTPPSDLDALLGADDRVWLSRRDLLAMAGITEAHLGELEECGLLASRSGGGYYDGDALVVARLFARMHGYGVQPRHLRSAKAAADREAGLIEQVTAPLRHQRTAPGSARATDTAEELAGLTVRLHAALLRSRLRRDATG